MLRKIPIVGGFAVAVWAVCGALIAIGRQFLSWDATLVVHALGAAVFTAALSWVYFRHFAVTGPLVTAAIFVATSLLLDFFVVAILIEKSFEMFASVLGVWIPQALIFGSTYLVGRVVRARRAPQWM